MTGVLHTLSAVTDAQAAKGYNWVPFVLTDSRAGTPVVAAQLNGDGTLFVDWAVVEELAAACPLDDPLAGLPMAHLLLAMRDGRFSETPRDCWVPAKSPA